MKIFKILKKLNENEDKKNLIWQWKEQVTHIMARTITIEEVLLHGTEMLLRMNKEVNLLSYNSLIYIIF